MEISGSKDYAKRAADRRALALAPDWKVLGYGNIAKPNGMGWHRDALHEHVFAPLYFPRVDFLAAGTCCDVKIPWELSRLQWLLWNAEAIACGPESCLYAHRKVAQATIDNWSSANPVGYGVNWACGMEVAIRGTLLAVICGVLSRDLDDAETDRLTGLLRAHQTFLARFPEVSDVPGNHYLADLMGEVVLHVALDGLYAKATERAIKSFSKAADLQFDADGCHIERSTIYHRLTLEMVALPYALGLRAGHSSTPALASVVQRAACFLAQIVDDSGVLPVFGDQDSGFVLWFGEAAQQVDARFCAAPGAPDTDLYCFLAGLSASPAFFPEITRQDGVRSGFGTLSGAGFRATLKTGPIGLQGRAAHDHDDALSVTVSHGLVPLLVDPGCHSYTLDPVIRRETIVSSRHNAPAPTARERHTPVMGSINATVRGAPTAVIRQQTADTLSGHLARTPASAMALTRELRITDTGLEIADHWRFDTAEGARLLWLLHPDWRIEMPGTADGSDSDMAISAKGLTLALIRGDTRLTARLTATEGARLAITTDRYSPDYGAWAACPALRLTLPTALEGRAGLTLAPAAWRRNKICDTTPRDDTPPKRGHDRR